MQKSPKVEVSKDQVKAQFQIITTCMPLQQFHTPRFTPAYQELQQLTWSFIYDTDSSLVLKGTNACKNTLNRLKLENYPSVCVEKHTIEV